MAWTIIKDKGNTYIVIKDFGVALTRKELRASQNRYAKLKKVM
jgi:hypothetical protein